ncbi:hypothetical protein LCGC14_1301510 [marine sediment metagenome]|uniref:Uncharacterized protein n=1 Tax=marine sediment metagenome TaxID=412755 RepID=A0A0F9KQV7_9ZZZZ
MDKEHDIKITLPHMENPKNKDLKNGLKEILEKEQAKGNISFSMNLIRKCDFCQRHLKEEDKFISLPQENGDILDKCSECQR